MAILDPTRTKMLRLQYSRQLTRLFKRFQKTIMPMLIDMINAYTTKYDLSKTMKSKKLKTLGVTGDVDNLLSYYIDFDILTPGMTVTQRNLLASYLKGIHGAKTKLDKWEIYEMGEYMTPLDWDALEIMQGNAYTNIVGCTSAMQRSINFGVGQGILNGWGTNKIAYAIRNSISGNQNMGIKRAKMIARTEVINAYNQAAKNRYKQAGLTEKEMIWITAFDERTCPICEGYDGMTIAQTGEVPPVHPNCRCSVAPNPR